MVQLPLWEGQCFVLTGVDTYSGYEFAFPVCNASAKTPSMDLQNVISPARVFYTELL